MWMGRTSAAVPVPAAALPTSANLAAEQLSIHLSSSGQDTRLHHRPATGREAGKSHSLATGRDGCPSIRTPNCPGRGR
ncbi:hypothetical protein B0H14DRAFT_3068647 [Mycena olivaceomarginata]|nr:hypothetical protein B0H14DRAFT_3068647 [Mycena olivaceomarginata]